MKLTKDLSVSLTVVYDNHRFDRRLRAAWGFACLVSAPGFNVLFDTGADGPTLLCNMQTLELNVNEINAVVLSHAHNDHIGGLDTLLKANHELVVYAPHAFPEAFKSQVRKRVRLVEVSEPMQISDGIGVTGEMGKAIVEQALLVQSMQGQIAITGCAHPGIVEMARFARQQGDIYLLMGGFHLFEKKWGEIEHIVSDLKALGVKKVAPGHCTGDIAIRILQHAFGGKCTMIGAGSRL